MYLMVRYASVYIFQKAIIAYDVVLCIRHQITIRIQRIVIRFCTFNTVVEKMKPVGQIRARLI